MEWKVIAALGMLGVAIVAGLVIAVVASVSKYAKQLTEEPKDPRRGFEVKQTTTTADTQSAVQRERDDHHG
jgi:hypothetical protein